MTLGPAAKGAATGVLGYGDPGRSPGDLRLSCARIAADLHIAQVVDGDDVVETAKDLYAFVRGDK